MTITGHQIAQILAWAVITLDLGASIGYFISGDWKRGVLWACWGIGTLMVTLK